MVSKVYFMDDRAGGVQDSIPFKAVKLLRDAGIETLFKKGDLVGIKTHMGEYGNALNLRPHWVKAIVEEVQRLGGRPVVFDCNTAIFSEYSARAYAEDHLKCVSRHGFNEETLGCPVWICDGEYGEDDVKVEIPNGVYMKHTFMGRKILEFDAVIVVSHFKGHPMGVYGGAIKNVGIGMASPRGKLTTHFFNHPVLGIKNWTINQEAVKKIAEGPRPNVLDNLIKSCPVDAFSYDGNALAFDKEKCILCGACMGPTMMSGMFNLPLDILPTWAPTIADSAAGIINAIGKDKMLYLNYAFDISPWCDCASFHDRPLVPNIGVFASKDPVAIDMACMEAAEAVDGMPGSLADEYGFSEPNTERFTNCSSMAKQSQWQQLNAAVFNGIGTTEYELITSEPADANEFIFPPYGPGNPFGYVHREAIGKIDWDPGDYCYELPRLSLGELNIRPKGKVEVVESEV